MARSLGESVSPTEIGTAEEGTADNGTVDEGIAEEGTVAEASSAADESCARTEAGLSDKNNAAVIEIAANFDSAK